MQFISLSSVCRISLYTVRVQFNPSQILTTISGIHTDNNNKKNQLTNATSLELIRRSCHIPWMHQSAWLVEDSIWRYWLKIEGGFAHIVPITKHRWTFYCYHSDVWINWVAFTCELQRCFVFRILDAMMNNVSVELTQWKSERIQTNGRYEEAVALQVRLRTSGYFEKADGLISRLHYDVKWPDSAGQSSSSSNMTMTFQGTAQVQLNSLLDEYRRAIHTRVRSCSLSAWLQIQTADIDHLYTSQWLTIPCEFFSLTVSLKMDRRIIIVIVFTSIILDFAVIIFL